MSAAAALRLSNLTPARMQVGALTLRKTPSGRFETLLVTSRETRRWVIPKGWPMKGRKDWQAAAEEAREEAGVVGKMRKKPIGGFDYLKRQATHFELCRVAVYRLEFDRQLDDWREKGQRERRWFSLDEAAAMVEEPGLAALITSLQAG